MEQKLIVSESYEKNENRYERGNHYVGVSIWHFEWCPKYRFKMFRKEEYRNLAEGCIRYAATRHKIRIKEIKVMPEHLHLVAYLPGTMSPSEALHKLKGVSAKKFFEKHLKARLRYPKGHLWSRGKFYASLGFVQVEVAEEYVRNQEEHHKLKDAVQGKLKL